MDPFVRRFIRASLIWLGIGVSIGILMAFPTASVVYRPAHMHANLLGFVSMMIFGVAYHVLPRFSGKPLHNPRLGALHLWFANLGLACMVGGWIAIPNRLPGAPWLLRAGGIMAAAGVFMFIYNIWRTLPRDAGSFAQLSRR